MTYYIAYDGYINMQCGHCHRTARDARRCIGQNMSLYSIHGHGEQVEARPILEGFSSGVPASQVEPHAQRLTRTLREQARRWGG